MASVKKYHVFISFRGKDTRKNFTSILYSALRDKRIETYIDEDKLEKGDEISSALLRAIEASMISVIVFSKNYAESRWCLDELNHILHCKETRGQLVLAVFYNVDPRNIRNQRGSYAAAFAKHAKRFKDETGKLDKWRESLTTAAGLAGWDSSQTRSDSDLIKAIVESITEKLQERISSTNDLRGLFGIENNMQKIESLLRIGSASDETHIVGIWGMGGIGKTTLARVLFEKFSSQFYGSSFLENVKEEVKKHQHLDLQKRVFSELLNEKGLNNVSQFEKEKLRGTNVLLVLDNVDNVKQLECLAKDRRWFGPGSRIVVTSRDSQVLKNITADEIYEVKELSFSDALELFLSKAFPEESPSEEYLKLAKTVVKKYTKGNPLALVVLGQCLCSRSVEEWKSEMELLDSTPNQEVQDILKVSYDGLSQNLKDIFLDIACFFKGQDRDSTQAILGYKYLGVVIEIRVLIDRALVTVNDRGEIWMHDLIQEMGQEIVCQQSNDPGERSRLWSSADVCDVLEDNRGTPKIQGMSLKCMSPSEITDSLTMGPLVLKEMRNLWFLDINPLDERKLFFPEDLDFLPTTLRYLRWNYCPLKSLPQSFRPKKLCELTIRGRRLERIWNSEFKDLQNLKVLDLNACVSLNQVLDLSCAPNLEDLDLSFCSSIDKFPLLPNQSNIKYLRMTATKIQDVPTSIECLTRVTILCLDCCYWLKSLPTSICKLKSLKILSMEESSKLGHFPEILEPMECLEQLLLDVTGIKELHPSIENLTELKTLSLQNCQNLEKLPDTIYNLQCLENVNINGCQKLKSLPRLPFSIKHLDARGCKSLETVSNPWIAFTQGPPRGCLVEQEFDFSDCLKLDRTNIVTEFHTRVLAGTAVSISQHQGSKLCHVPRVGICSPANEIPKWFYAQSEGSSITMKLDPGWCSSTFAGFTVCALVSFTANSSFARVSLVCESRFVTEHGETLIKPQRPFNANPINNFCDHVVMQSCDVDYGDVSGAVEVSFEFSQKGRGTFVRACGIRMLHLKDVEEFHAESNVASVLGPLDCETIIQTADDEPEPTELSTVSFGREELVNDRVECCMIL